jgi:hypothetical protein
MAEPQFEAWMFTVLRRVITDEYRDAPTAEDLARVAYAEPQAVADPSETVCDREEAVWLDSHAEEVVPPKRHRILRVFRQGGGVDAVAREFDGGYVRAQNEVARTRKPLRDLLASSRRVGILPPVRPLRVRRSRQRPRRLLLAPAFLVVAVALVPVLPRIANPWSRRDPNAMTAKTYTANDGGRSAVGVRPSVPLSMPTPPPLLPPIPGNGTNHVLGANDYMPRVGLPDYMPVPSPPPTRLPEPDRGRHGVGSPPQDYLLACVRHLHVGLHRVGCQAGSPSPSPR